MVEVVTIDGPGGSGKGSVATRLANSLGWHILPSGSIYRAIAWKSEQESVDIDDVARLTEVIAKTSIDFAVDDNEVHTYVDGKCVDREIIGTELGARAARISSYAPVRQALLDFQRSFLVEPGLVAEGRDMGTVVFPDARLKIYLDASLSKRAQRRLAQLQKKGIQDYSLEAIEEAIKKRDLEDQRRTHSPLMKAPGCISVDSSDLSLEETTDKINALVKETYKIVD